MTIVHRLQRRHTIDIIGKHLKTLFVGTLKNKLNLRDREKNSCVYIQGKKKSSPKVE